MARSMLIVLVAMAAPFLVAATTNEVMAGNLKALVNSANPLELRMTHRSANIQNNYVKMQYTSIDLVDEAGSTISALTASTNPGDVYFNAQADAKYYRSTVGTRVGTAAVGAFIGSSNYLARQEFEYNKVNVINGVSVCASNPRPSGGAVGDCGAKRSVKPGTYKFAVYAKTTGNAFAIPAGAKYLRVTTRLTAVGGENVAIYFNGNPGQTDVPSGQLEKVTFEGGPAGNTTSLTWTFEQKYILDDVTQGDIRLTAAKVNGQRAMDMFVDLPLTGVTSANQTLVYDPEISDAGYNAASGLKASLLLFAAVVALSAFMGFQL